MSDTMKIVIEGTPEQIANLLKNLGQSQQAVPVVPVQIPQTPWTTPWVPTYPGDQYPYPWITFSVNQHTSVQ